MKKRVRVKGWILLGKKFLRDMPLGVFLRKKDCVFSGGQPCTITYTLPAKRRKRK